jgi:uncharacterized LabA/DUF88 family protein
MVKETYVFIDGAYLSLISKHFGKGKYLNFDIHEFATGMAKSEGLWLKGTFYYTAPPFQGSHPSKDEIQRKSRYDRFVSNLRKIQNFVIREGRCQRVDGEYHQKGVDTLFTMDLFDVSRDRSIETFLLVTCDTDFVPILNKLRELGIKIVLFYFSDFERKSRFSMSNHILTACDKKVLLTPEHFKNSMKK